MESQPFCIQLADWDNFLAKYPDVHLLQTGPWGELKSGFGWDAARLVVGNAGAQVLFRRVLPGFVMAYIPKGPVGEDWSELWVLIDQLCQHVRAVFLKVEVDCWENISPGRTDSIPTGFQVSNQTIQPRRTLVVDLRPDEDQILAHMRQKTRYNIRLAQKKGVNVRPDSDIERFYQLVKVTATRDSFGVHSNPYYRRVYDLFHPKGECELLIAEYQGLALGGLMVFAHGERAYYFYGASANEHREKMPSYLLQWEAMRWAKEKGCLEYDLWGIPDFDEDVLEANFEQRSDGLWGVYRFKRGFGGEVRRAQPAWDRVYQPFLYRFYQAWSSRRAHTS